MSTSHRRALTSSPFGPFADDRWRYSPTPEPALCPKDAPAAGHIVWGYNSTPPTPPLIYRTPISYHQGIRPSANSPDALGGDDESDDESSGPVTPHCRSEKEVKWGWEDSPFKDDRWAEEPATEVDEDGDEESSCGPVTPGPRTRKEALGWEDSPFRDDRWREEPESEVEVEMEGKAPGLGYNALGVQGWWDDFDGQHAGAAKGGWYEEAADGSIGPNENPSSDEVDAARGRGNKLQRTLWPGTSARPIPRLRNRKKVDINFDLDDEHDQDRFWLGSRSRPSPSPIQARLRTPVQPIRRKPTPTPPPADDSDPFPRVHIATHLSSRLGHTRMLDAALRLVLEEDMSGLSMYLYCPKKHVREVWPEEKVREVRERLDRLEEECPGFRDRVFVHAHETINLACPGPGHDHGQRRVVRGRSNLEVHEDTIDGLSTEMATLEELGLRYLVVHPGSSLRCGGKGDDQATLKIIASNIDLLLDRHPTITIVLESMTCTNHRLAGTSLRSLSTIRSLSAYPERVKFCLDLCHVHSMSHDLSSTPGRAVFFDDVETILGGDNVVCGHVSECGVEHGAGRDVHADFGSGYIGDSAFRAILTHPLFARTTWIIETPRHLPQIFTSRRVEALEVDRQVMDIAHLRYLTTASAGEWENERRRGVKLQSREKAVKVLRRKMWAEVRGGKYGRGLGEERRAREERKKRGRLGRVRARGAKAARDDGCDEGERDVRSPKRAREARAAKERRKRKISLN